MVSFREFDETKMVEYTTEELRGFIHEIEMRYGVVVEKCASEMAECVNNDKFDLYSARGERKIKKIAEKHAPMFEAAEEFMRIINTELSRREDFEEQSRYSGRGLKTPIKNQSAEEFLQQEQDKTDLYRSKID